MIKDVLETYRCLLSCRKKMPGMRLEDAFPPESIKSLEAEAKWVEALQKKIKEKIDD
jgi:hypothetical protein